MNEHEIERIAAALNQARPDWPVKQLRTLLGDERIAHRPRRDVFVALAWVACEANTATPYRVLESGPWWRAAGIEGQAQQRTPFDPAHTCGTCGLSEPLCRRNPHGEHEFTSTVDTKRAAVPHDRRKP